MRIRIEHSPTFSTLAVGLDAAEGIVAEPNSMLSMTTGIEVTARMGGTMKGGSSIGKGLRNLVSGESFFAAVYRARSDDQTLMLAPAAIGELVSLEVRSDRQLVLTSGAFLACEEGVTLDARYAGFKGWLSQKGLFLMHVEGEGRVFAAAHGAVVVKELAEGERIVVDNAFVVAFTEGLSYELVKAAASLKDSVMSGEGLANRYTGPGCLWYQTRRRIRDGGWVRGLVEVAT